MSVVNYPVVKFFNVSSPAEYVAHIEINRPEKLNAFIDPMWTELKTLVNFCSTSPEVRCVLISGAGERAFTAGLDVQAASAESSPVSAKGFFDPSRKANYLRQHVLELQDTVSSVARCNKPTIALLHGYTYGLGIDLATACDIRLCVHDTKFSVKEVDIGVAADVGTLSRLPKVVGGLTSWVKNVCLTARQFSAKEALHNNLVSDVVNGSKNDLFEEGLKLAQIIASKSPVAVLGTKNILDASWGRTIEDNLNYTAVWASGMAQSSDVERAMLSGLQKRTPTFEKL